MSEKECNDFKLTKTGKKVNQKEAMITLNIIVIIRCFPCFWFISILLFPYVCKSKFFFKMALRHLKAVIQIFTHEKLDIFERNMHLEKCENNFPFLPPAKPNHAN